MATRWMFGSKRRHDLWLRCQYMAQDAGRGDLPVCPHCDRPVAKSEPWHECHIGRPKWMRGKTVRVGHAACNLKDAREVVVPAKAKSDRIIAKREGRKGPGLGRHPMRFGRRSPFSKTFSHGVVRRQTLAEKLAATLAKRSFDPDSSPPVALPAFPFDGARS